MIGRGWLTGCSVRAVSRRTRRFARRIVGVWRLIGAPPEPADRRSNRVAYRSSRAHRSASQVTEAVLQCLPRLGVRGRLAQAVVGLACPFGCVGNEPVSVLPELLQP